MASTPRLPIGEAPDRTGSIEVGLQEVVTVKIMTRRSPHCRPRSDLVDVWTTHRLQTRWSLGRAQRLRARETFSTLRSLPDKSSDAQTTQ